jgi:hypothetical protein
MRTPGPLLSCIAVPLIALFLLSCGSGNHGPLQSITISPATADAQNFANGQVKFTATGTYTDGTKASPLPVLWWGPDPPWYNPPPGPISAFVDSNGVAACFTFIGSYTVSATAPVDPHFPLSKMTAAASQVVGTAQLSCP